MADQQPYVTIRTRRPADGNSVSSADSTYGSTNSPELGPKSATHDISRASYHVKHIGRFAQTLEDSATRAFPNRGRPTQRYKSVQALLLHWGSDDLFVLPELEDLDKCLKEDYAFDTDIFAIPSENSHLELMMKVAQLIKTHEAEDTLFIIYYGGHAKIDESRQSTWCATRHPTSPWLQWSAIQTLLERSASDVLILLDCCAGAASATFPTGNSITETISASSWDAIAPDPGRYSFTNALIEVLQDWRTRSFSAAMIHAEVLARLKHPRPITINGKHFEARSTPVHFMMTANHKAPSIEMSRIVPAEKRPPSPPQEISLGRAAVELSRRDTAEESIDISESPVESPNEDTPHVMISLALEDDQRLDVRAWEQWLASFPALAKYVKVQGVFKSHSTLLLLSMPVMIWDLLPEDHATSFIAFIRSNNMLAEKTQQTPADVPAVVSTGQPTVAASESENFSMTTRPVSVLTGTTLVPYDGASIQSQRAGTQSHTANLYHPAAVNDTRWPGYQQAGQASSAGYLGTLASSPSGGVPPPVLRPAHSTTSLPQLHRRITPSSFTSEGISRTMILNQQRSAQRTAFVGNVPEPPKFASHVEARLEDYYERDPLPNNAYREFVASNLGIETFHVDTWFHYRRERDVVKERLQALKIDEPVTARKDEARMVLPGHLNTLLDILPGQALLIDLRTTSEFEKSHIYGAVNLQVPLNFAQQASFDMLERAFTDEQSRRKFSSWRSARCMVFYDRTTELAVECPIADALLRKLRGAGWDGQCFVLKGSYREFCVNYGKYIVGSNMTQEAKDYVDGLREKVGSRPDAAEVQRRYRELTAQLDSEERVHESTPSPVQAVARMRAVEARQRDLEVEFQRRFPDLHRKALDVFGPETARPASEPAGGNAAAGTLRAQNMVRDDNFDAKAPMIEYLDRGLDKMREASTAAPPLPSPSRAPGHPKLDADGYFEGRTERAAPGEQGHTDRADGAHRDSALGTAASPEGDTGSDDVPRRGGRGGGFLNKVLRRA